MKTIYESNAELAAQLDAYKQKEQQLELRERECASTEERLQARLDELNRKQTQIEEESKTAIEERQRQLDSKYDSENENLVAYLTACAGWRSYGSERMKFERKKRR